MASPEALHSSNTNEHVTPVGIIEAARAVMGSIDIDPATTPRVNRTFVHARHIYTADTNGLDKHWRGNVFVNPPGGHVDSEFRRVVRRKGGGCTITGECGIPAPHKHEGVKSSTRLWWEKTLEEYNAQRARACIFIAFSIELLQSSQLSYAGDPNQKCALDFPFCIPRERLEFYYWDTEDKTFYVGTANTHSSAIILLPSSRQMTSDFERHFSEFGRVVIP